MITVFIFIISFFMISCTVVISIKRIYIKQFALACSPWTKTIL